MKASVENLCQTIINQNNKYKPMSAFAVAISGIDGSGKGFVAQQLQNLLEENGCRTALVSMDEWQMPKAVALMKENAAENFYHNVFRWNAFFDSFFIPLQKNRSIQLAVKHFSTPNDEVVIKKYDFSNINILLVEGIFLLKKDLAMFFDYKIWIDCSFETSLKRALQRNQEGLSNLELLNDYNTYYHPAQQYHFEKDEPRKNADTIFINE